MSSMDNLDALMNAANLKLKTQQEIQDRENGVSSNTNTDNSQEDIYASIRSEVEEDYQRPTINYHPDDSNNGPNIEHDGIPERDFYLEEDSTPLFENGPSVSQVELWKKQYAREKVFHTQILDKHFVFRTLNRFEYKQIVAIDNIDALYREEIICATCVLWPFGYNFKKMAEEDSGYPSTLAQIIMENSGFTKEYGIEVL